jgi:hypothetical protein
LSNWRALLSNRRALLSNWGALLSNCRTLFSNRRSLYSNCQALFGLEGHHWGRMVQKPECRDCSPAEPSSGDRVSVPNVGIRSFPGTEQILTGTAESARVRSFSGRNGFADRRRSVTRRRGSNIGECLWIQRVSVVTEIAAH